MTDETDLKVDEARRLALHGAVKNEVGSELHSEIGMQVHSLNANQRRQAAVVAEQLKQKALDELSVTQAQIERAKSAARISQIVDYIFLLIYGFIGLEIFLEMMGARQGNSFKIFIDMVSAPLLAPFKAIVPSLILGRYELNFSYILALLVYALLHPAVKGLLRMVAHRRTKI